MPSNGRADPHSAIPSVTSRTVKAAVPAALPEAVDRQRKSSRAEPRRTINTIFRTFANGTARIVGSPWTFILAVTLVVAWGASYRLFVHHPKGSPEYENEFNTWQLVINTATTIVTFLMVFLIQNTQNRDAKAIHLKLDELIRAVEGARTRLVDLENLTDDELERLEREFKRIHEREARKPNHEAHTGVDDADVDAGGE